MKSRLMKMKKNGGLRRAAMAMALLLPCALIAASCAKKSPPAPPGVSASCDKPRANGLDQCVFKITGEGGAAVKAQWTVSAFDKDVRPLEDAVTVVETKSDSVTVQTSLTPCRLVAMARVGGKSYSKRIKVEEDFSDADKDGFPDVAELNTQNDRLAFRAWFTTIAASQFDSVSDGWDKEAQDCAGLVRFAYREALRAHDTEALAKFRSLSRTDIPDVGKYNYPGVPVIGKLLFRNHRGAFDKADLTNGTLSPFASARFLQESNTHFVSKDLSAALPGDLMFFLHFDDVTMPYHTMIFLGAPRGSAGASPGIVYHTGPVGKTNGRIKRITVDDLMRFPDARWRPEADNEYFLGVYRFNILD